jgi:L-iditol 2-dehydrogenase
LIRNAMDATRPGGRVLLFAQTQHGEAIIDPAAVCVDEKTLLGSYSASVDIQDEALRIVFDGYGKGYDLTRLISHRFPLSEAVQALAIASDPKPTSMKIVVEPWL